MTEFGEHDPDSNLSDDQLGKEVQEYLDKKGPFQTPPIEVPPITPTPNYPDKSYQPENASSGTQIQTPNKPLATDLIANRPPIIGEPLAPQRIIQITTPQEKPKSLSEKVLGWLKRK